jgi:PilZ domain
VTQKSPQDNRRNARIEVSHGMWVAWTANGPRNVSRVRDLSSGGVFVSTKDVVPVGTAVQLLFSLPEGEIRVHGVVRYTALDRGFGVEFTRMGVADRARLQELLRRLKR